jgi:inward rectifier potassium channel
LPKYPARFFRSYSLFGSFSGPNDQLIEAAAKVIFTRFVEENGRLVRRFDLLELERNQVFFLTLVWAMAHAIDENLSMCGLMTADFENMDAEILILLSGTDESIAQRVHARTFY